ncbi:hypothetical protein [Streptomyces chartreusis]|uniref:hypothetical protein n=1 Tax=Streptomyces chartreusis TaxID=1969 RepID=UPI002E185D6A
MTELTCVGPDCTNAVKVKADLLCDGHYWQKRKGRPLTPLRPQARRGELRRWLERAVTIETNECIIWPFAAKDRDGYGQIKVDGVQRKAHAVALELASGEPAGDRQALHHCDNPPCVNRRHLYWGDSTDNNRDTVERLRHKGRSNLTHEEVREIRRRFIPRRRGVPSNALELATEFSTSRQAIWRAARGASFTRVE